MYRNKTGLPWADYLNAKASQRRRPLPSTHGIRCSHCHDIHPYNGAGKLGIDYVYRDSQLTVLWLCPQTELVIGELLHVVRRKRP